MVDDPDSGGRKPDEGSVPSLSRATSRSIAISSWGPGFGRLASGRPGSGRPGSASSGSGSSGSPRLGVLTPFGGLLANQRRFGRPRSVSLSYLLLGPHRGPWASTRSVVEARSTERAGGGAQSDQRTVVVDRRITEGTGAGEGTAERTGRGTAERADRGESTDSKPDSPAGRTRVVQILRDEGAEGEDGSQSEDGSRDPTETVRDEGRNRRFRLPATDRGGRGPDSADRGRTFSDRVAARASAPDSARRGTASSATGPEISLQVVDRMRGGDRDRKAGGDVGSSGIGGDDDATGRDDVDPDVGVVGSPERPSTAGPGDDRERSRDRLRGAPDLTWRRAGARPDARRRGKTGRSRTSGAGEAAGRGGSEREAADEPAARDRSRGRTNRSGDGADGTERAPDSGEISLADVDTGRIVDRLYRELERKRRIERERRGL